MIFFSIEHKQIKPHVNEHNHMLDDFQCVRSCSFRSFVITFDMKNHQCQ